MRFWFSITIIRDDLMDWSR